MIDCGARVFTRPLKEEAGENNGGDGPGGGQAGLGPGLCPLGDSHLAGPPVSPNEEIVEALVFVVRLLRIMWST